MADPRFYPAQQGLRLSQLLDGVAEKLSAPADPVISGAAALEAAQLGEVSFLTANKRYRAVGEKTQAEVVFVQPGAEAWLPKDCIQVVCQEPARVMNHVVARLYPQLVTHPAGLAPTAIAPDADVHPTTEIGSGVVIGAGASIGARTVIGANSVIGPGVQIGADCQIFPSATIQYALLGDRVYIAPGARIGADGFGLLIGKTHLKVYHIGRVILQSDVEIGANTCVDRGTYGDTVIGEGSKIDNLVQIAHNCQIGRHVRISGGSGLAGSVVIKDYVVLGGAAGVGDGVTIGEGAMIAAKSAVLGIVPDGAFYGGHPARPLKEWQRERAFVRRLVKKADAVRVGSSDD